MNDLIQIKATGVTEGGKLLDPQDALKDRELGYHRSEKALYIGVDGFDIKLCQADDVGRKAGFVDEVPEDAELGEVIASLNSLISALKESGLMRKE